MAKRRKVGLPRDGAGPDALRTGKALPVRGKGEVRERITSGGARGAMDATLKMHDVDPAAFPMQRGPKAAKKKGKR